MTFGQNGTAFLDLDKRGLTYHQKLPCKRYASIIFSMTLTLFFSAFLYVYFFSVGWQVYSGKSGDRVSTVELISLTLSCIIVIVNASFMFFKHGAIQKLVSKFIACNSDVNKMSRLGRNIHANLRIVKKRALIFWSVLVVNALMYLVPPFFKTGRHFPDDNLILYGLDPMNVSPNYEIAYTLTVCAMFTVTYIPAHVGSFFIIVCGYIESYMLALSKELEAVWKDALESREINEKEENEKEYTKKIGLHHSKQIAKFIENRLVHIAKRQIKIITLKNKVHELYQLSLAAELTVLMITLVTDLLYGFGNATPEIVYSLFMMGKNCLAGQMITEASVTFERAMYFCKWENFDPQNRKIVLLLLTYSQKTMQLSAGGVTTLSTETFGKILKAIYSTYTALQSTVHKK